MLLYAKLEESKNTDEFVRDEHYVNGLVNVSANILTHVSISTIPGIEHRVNSDGNNRITFSGFPNGTVLVLKVAPSSELHGCRNDIIERIGLMNAAMEDGSSELSKGELSGI